MKGLVVFIRQNASRACLTSGFGRIGRAFFENFGTVLEAFVSYDRHTGRPRGFGFVVFEDPAVADKVVSLQHTIDRREVKPYHSWERVRPRADVAGSFGRQPFVGRLGLLHALQGHSHAGMVCLSTAALFSAAK